MRLGERTSSVIRSLSPSLRPGLVALAITLVFPSLLAKEKIKPEQLIERHLDSIAPADVRAELKTIVATGEAAAVPRRGGSGRNEGGVMVASEGATGRFLLYMRFATPSYPHEKIGFDGENSFVANISPGVRSPLGNILHNQDGLITEGLIGSVLTTDWALLHSEELNPKLNYKGVKKFDGEKYHTLEYKPRRSTDFKIRLFFDQETYRHVASEYKLMLAAGMVRLGTGNSPASEKRVTLVEKYSDFREQTGLTLPHHYEIRLTLEQNQTLIIDWLMDFSDFQVNQPVDPAAFAFVQ
jgi:hypothetical protein